MDSVTKIEKKIYSKQKSFVNLNLFFKEDKIKTLKVKIKKVLNAKNKPNNIVKNQAEIIKCLKKDLFENRIDNRPKFELTPNIIKEIFLFRAFVECFWTILYERSLENPFFVNSSITPCEKINPLVKFKFFNIFFG